MLRTVEALQIMRSSGEALPRGLRLEGDEWHVPIQFGVDAATPGEAEAFGVDHNNLTAAGGGGGREALTDLWDAAGIHALLEDLGGNGAAPNTADAFDDYEAFAQAVGKPTSDDSKDPQFLRPVLHVQSLELLERALRATGRMNRGEALIVICEAYLAKG